MKKLVLLAAFVAICTISCTSEISSGNVEGLKSMEEIRCMTKSAKQQDLYDFLENCNQFTEEEKVIFYNELSKRSNIFVTIRKDKGSKLQEGVKSVSETSSVSVSGGVLSAPEQKTVSMSSIIQSLFLSFVSTIQHDSTSQHRFVIVGDNFSGLGECIGSGFATISPLGNGGNYTLTYTCSHPSGKCYYVGTEADSAGVVLNNVMVHEISKFTGTGKVTVTR